MSGHEWKVLGAFGLLLGGLSLYDAAFATKVAGVALVVIIVRNANKLPLIDDTTAGAPKAKASSSPPGSSTLHV